MQAKNNVFLTGVTGFVGRYLLYQLCEAEWIDEIYVLVRPKKDVAPKERFAEVLKDPLYEEARKLGVTFDNIHVISGDVQQPKMGMSQEDIQLLSEKLTLVIHNAASLNFAAHIHDSFKSNTFGAWELYQMCCNDFNNRPSFLFVSTIATNSHFGEVPEEVTPFSAPAKVVYDYIRSNPRERVEENSKFFLEDRLDGYGFAKGIAERMIFEDIEENGGTVPVHFIRPGGIIGAWNGPLRGWVHNTCFYAQLGYFVYNDQIPLFLVDRNCEFNMAPVDMVGNMIMASCLENLEKREKGDFSVQVVNGKKPCVEGVNFDVIITVLRENYAEIVSDKYGLREYWDNVGYTPNKNPPKGPFQFKSPWVFNMLFSLIYVGFWLYSFFIREAQYLKLKKLFDWFFKYIHAMAPYITRPISVGGVHTDHLHQKYGDKYPMDGETIDRTEFMISFYIGMAKYIVPAAAAREQRYKKRLENAGMDAGKKKA